MTLHIFNPDTDYALASDRRYFTPPAQVIALRKQLALVPACYACPGDSILLLDDIKNEVDGLPYFGLTQTKGLQILSIRELEERRYEYIDHALQPWGWNRSIRQLLADHLGQNPNLPSEAEIQKLRELSHRRTTIRIHELMSEFVSDEIRIPGELHSVGEAIELYREDRRLFFKAPWSSSGRGIILTDDLEERHVEPWVRGIIKKQGSVMVEKAYNKVLDFATEWWIADSKAEFIGYSVFNASRRGKYHSNVTGSQSELEQLIVKSSRQWNPGIVEGLKTAIERVIAIDYSGPLGVDMLVTDSGAVNPCVELNLRHTMGMLNLPFFLTQTAE